MGRFVLFTTIAAFLAASGCAEDSLLPVVDSDPTIGLETEVETIKIGSSDLVIEVPSQCIPPDALGGIELRLYRMPDLPSDIPSEVVLEGCRVWAPLGITCRLVDNARDANLSIAYSDSVPRSQAVAALTGRDDTPTKVSFTFFRGWNTNRYTGESAPEELLLPIIRTISAHEIGHAFLLGHIPNGSDTTRPVQDPETRVDLPDMVGLALMNGGGLPDEFIASPHLTELDVRFFWLQPSQRSRAMVVMLGYPPCAPIE